ncbi:PAS domain-containing protein [Trujillonella humicola]|uniref:PAS domain-containing protein n=1 Tax=Trujillonella humicola TaxID=3383699 RepID=UPI003906790A
MVSDSLVSGIVGSAWFRDDRAPYVLLDTRMRIRAVNEAFVRATAHPAELLLGRPAFDVFPAGPSDPAGDGVRRVSESVERVLRAGARDWMGFQRYDVPVLGRPGRFARRVWAPVNSPVHEDGRVTGVLHHVQDVTEIADGWRGAAPVPRAHLGDVAEELASRFPEVPAEEVVAIVTSSERLVLETLRGPDPLRSAELATLRLEIRAGRPMSDAGRPMSDAG